MKWNLKALSLGIVTAIAVSFTATMFITFVWTFVVALLNRNTGTFDPTKVVTPTLYAITFVVDGAIYWIAGLVVGRMTRGSELRHTAVIGVTIACFTALMVYLFPPDSDLRRTVDYISYALAVIPLLAGYYLSKRQPRPQ